MLDSSEKHWTFLAKRVIFWEHQPNSIGGLVDDKETFEAFYELDDDKVPARSKIYWTRLNKLSSLQITLES